MEISIKYNINDDEWTFTVLTKDDYESKNGTDSKGITDTEAKTVDFLESEFKLTLIRHELFHVHMFYAIYEWAQPDSDQLEEVAAEIFTHRGEKIGNQAKEIYKKLRG